MVKNTRDYFKVCITLLRIKKMSRSFAGTMVKIWHLIFEPRLNHPPGLNWVNRKAAPYDFPNLPQ